MAANHDLLQVAQDGNLANLQAALAKGAEVNAQDKNGDTALMAAAEKGHRVIVQELLAQDGIEVNAQDKDGDTALIVAAGKGYKEIVRALLAKGADVHIIVPRYDNAS